jgi:hypothetical protein
MDEPSGGTLRFSGHWILTNVFVTQANILTSITSTPTSVKASPANGTLPYLFAFFKNCQPQPEGLGDHLINQISQLRQVT